MSEVKVVSVEGDVDLSRAPGLREELRRSVDNRDMGLVVDLTEARYIDSSGVNVLFEIAEDLAQRQLQFAVVVPEGGIVERVVTLVDLSAAAAIHRSADAAVAAMRP